MKEKIPHNEELQQDMSFEEFVRRAEDHRQKMQDDKQYRLDVLRAQRDKIGTKEFDLEIYQLEKELAKGENNS